MVVKLWMALFFIILYFYKFSTMDICKLHNEEKKASENIKPISGSDKTLLWCAFLWLFPSHLPTLSSSGAAVLVPLTVAPDWAKDYFCAYRPVQGKIWCSLTGTHSALWTQGRSCSFVVLCAQHRIDFLSHVMLSGGAKKEQKSKPKSFPSTV